MEITPTAVAPASEDQQTSATAQSSQDMEDFIYLISHDVRASVRALLELPQWIREDLEGSGVRINAQVANSIDLMNRHTGRLDRMLVDLLAYSRVGRLQTPQELDLDQVLSDVLEDMRVPSGFMVSRDLSCSRIFMGESDLPILLRELISNGIKHHDRKSGQVVVASRREGGTVVLTVSDNRPGIDPQFHDRIFAPMTTLRPRDEVEGSGMGLAKANKIAQVYGGGISVLASPFGRGACFEVRVASGRLS